MAIRLPNLGPSSSGPAPGGVSMSDAMAPSLALGSVARGLGAASQELERHDERIKQVQNSADITEARTGMKKRYADFQNQLAERNDYTNFKDDWGQVSSEIKQELSSKNLSPQARNILEREFMEFDANAEIGVVQFAQKKAVARRDQAFKNEMTMIEQDFDPSNPANTEMRVNQLLDTMNFSPEVREAVLMQTKEFMKERKTFMEIQDDAGKWMKDHGKPEGDYDTWQRNFAMAERVLNKNKREQIQGAYDAIYSKGGADDSVIEGLTPDLSPYERAKVIEQRDRLSDAVTRKTMNSEPYQSELVGSVSGMIETYEPTGLNADKPLFEIKNLLEQMKDGVTKDMLQGQLDDITEAYDNGQELAKAEAKTVKDWSIQQIKEDFTARREKEESKLSYEGKSLQAYVDEGVLKDKEMLSDFGYSEQQVAQITGADKPADAMELIRKYWDAEGAGPRSEDFPTEFGAVFQAIRDDKTGSTMIKDPKREAEVQEATRLKMKAINTEMGQSLISINRLLAADENMTIQQANSILGELKVDVEAGETGIDFGMDIQGLGDRGEEGPLGERAVGNAKVIMGSRDQIKGFESKAGARMISNDFNDAANKSARGIEFTLPSDYTQDELSALTNYAKGAQRFFSDRGLNIPIRHGNGAVNPRNKDGSYRKVGKAGVIHLEPFFAANKEARNIIMNDPVAYGRVILETLGGIAGASFIAPHEMRDQGAVSGEYSERDFGMKVILPGILEASRLMQNE